MRLIATDSKVPDPDLPTTCNFSQSRKERQAAYLSKQSFRKTRPVFSQTGLRRRAFLSRPLRDLQRHQLAMLGRVLFQHVFYA
jgi:hypothetical protein